MVYNPGFLAMIGHVKINYRPKNQGGTPFTGWVFLKFCFRSFLVHMDVLWKIRNFLKYFQMVYNHGSLYNDWSREHKL